MGIFEFIKDLTDGKSETKDHELEASLMQTLNSAGLELKDLSLKVSKGTALLSGVAGSLKDAEIARLMVGNHKGIERVNDDGLKVIPSKPSILLSQQPQNANAQTPSEAGQATAVTSSQPAKMVTVRKGDTLSKIAKEQLGNANRYKEIFEANKPMLKDPDEIYPGQVLRIPSEGMAVAH